MKPTLPNGLGEDSPHRELLGVDRVQECVGVCSMRADLCKTMLVHRVVWELTQGPIPEGANSHACDNPGFVCDLTSLARHEGG